MQAYVSLVYKSCWILMIAVLMLAGCVPTGNVETISSLPLDLNPKMITVCHDKSRVVATEIPEAFLKDRSKVTLLVKMQTHIYAESTSHRAPIWSAFSPEIIVNDKVSFFLRPVLMEPTQYRILELDKSDLQPGLNTVTVSTHFDGGCSSPCCSMGIGLVFEDDPSIPFI